jgi:hypothetical protein
MPKHNATGRSKTDGPHVRIYAWFAKSAAWRAMKPGPRALYVELAGFFKGTNNGELFLSERAAAKRLNIDKKTARGYFKELLEKGFIRVSVKGSFDHKDSEGTSWILTEHGAGDRLATRDFMRWEAPEYKKPGGKKSPRQGQSFPRAGPDFST